MWKLKFNQILNYIYPLLPYLKTANKATTYAKTDFLDPF